MTTQEAMDFIESIPQEFPYGPGGSTLVFEAVRAGYCLALTKLKVAAASLDESTEVRNEIK